MTFNGYRFKLLHEDNKKEITIEAKDVDDLYKYMYSQGYEYIGTGDFLERVFMKQKNGALPDVILFKREGS